MKRIISIVLALLLSVECIFVAPVSVSATEITEPDVQEATAEPTVPQETEAPAEAEVPEETEVPTEEVIPEETEANTEEVIPEETEVPTEEAIPEETEVPVETKPEKGSTRENPVAEDSVSCEKPAVSSVSYETITEGETKEVTVSAEETVYFSFTPEQTHGYTFYSENSSDAYCALYDSNMEELDSSDDSEDSVDFSLSYTFQANTTYILGVCTWDETDTFSVGLKSKHTGEGTIVTPATCQAEGLKRYTCEYCGQAVEEVIPVLEHDYEETIVTQATCQATGLARYVCSACGDTFEEIISKEDHDYESVIVTPATCQATGLKRYTCNNCGHVQEEVIPMEDHSYVDGICETCGEGITEMLLGQAYTIGAQDSNLTYFRYTPAETGWYTLYSVGTDDSKEGYLYDSAMNALAEAEYSYNAHCFELTFVLEKGKTYILAAEKGWSDDPFWVKLERIQFTAISAGVSQTAAIAEAAQSAWFTFTPSYTETYTIYSVGGADTVGTLYDSEMNEMGISWDEGEDYNFSITDTLEAGSTYFISVGFQNPAETGRFSVMIKNNHSKSTETVTKEATCTEPGEKQCTCQVCGETYSEEIPATGHSWNENDICTLCGKTFYAEGMCGQNLSWYLDNTGVLTISGTGKMTAYNWGDGQESTPWIEQDLLGRINKLVIEPGVTSIGSCAFMGFEITDVTIPGSVQSIDWQAFGFSNLQSITLQDGILRLGDGAFYACQELASLTIPASVKEIGYYAFAYCDKLTSITFTGDAPVFDEEAFFALEATVYYPASNPTWTEDVLQDYDPEDSDNQSVVTWVPYTVEDPIPEGLEYSAADDGVTITGYTGNATEVAIPATINGKAVTAIGDFAFDGCENLTSITIPDSVTSVGTGAFHYCTSLTSMNLPNSVTKMGSDLFASCHNLVNVTLPAGITEISDAMFSSCDSLENFVIPDSVTRIGTLAFHFCSSLTSIEIPDSVTEFGSSIFAGCSKLTSVKLPAGITEIPDTMFGSCSSLESFTIPDTVTYVGYAAFAHCRGLTSMVIPDSVTELGASLFEGCSNLVSVKLPAGITEITPAMFGSCSKLQSFVIPDTVTYIGPSAFANCSSLSSIQFLGNVPTFDTDDTGSFPYETFENVTATAYYPCDNETWTENILQNYGGSITWEPNHEYVDNRCVICGDQLLSAPKVSIANIASSGKIKLTWEKVEGAAKYKVYRATSKTGTYSLLKTTTGTSLSNTSAVAGKQYYYYVIAVGENGAESEKSNIVTRVCDLPQPVLKATNVASTGKIKLTWDKIDGAKSYKVYRSTSKTTGYTLLKTTTGTSLTNTSVEVGTRYYYKVYALHESNSSANSAYSSVVNRTCDLPKPVVKISVVSSTGKLKLSWEKIEGAKNYSVYRSVDGGETYSLLKTTTGTALTNTSITAGNKYYYKVKANHTNSAANSAYSDVKSGTCDLPRPVAKVALNSKGKPVVTWAKIDGAVKYTVYIYNADGSLLKTSSTTGVKLTHSSAVKGTTYKYRVVAVHTNTAANSAKSTTVSITSK